MNYHIEVKKFKEVFGIPENEKLINIAICDDEIGRVIFIGTSKVIK